MSKRIINTNIRFDLDKEDDRKAYEYLQSMDRKQYKSYTRAVVTALNFYFDRQTQLEADHYLETREKEDMFLQKVLETIERGLKSAGNINGIIQLLSANTERQQAQSNTEDDNDAALNFADGF